MSNSTSSLPSPKIRFKELDVEFLQRQARIWLEAVVGERYDQNIALSNLLANGEILRKVSSKIWEFMQKHGDKESTSSGPSFPEASSNGKHSGRYLPYSNIDTFLKVCQKLGLTGVDLFSPPDVVEEKDIRRVCLCIRALSQKARARNGKVPDFDYVTHSTMLPTEIIGSVKSLTHHLNAVIIESKETPEKLSRNPLLPKRSADHHKDTNGQPNFLSVEIPKDKDVIPSSLITDACTKPTGKPSKATMHTKAVPLSASEEISKSTNDSKVVSAREETTIYYEGFRKKINKALFEDDLNLKQSSHLNQQLLYTLKAEEVIPYATSSSGDNSDEALCTMDSLMDTSQSLSKSMEEKQEFELSIGKNPPDKGDKHKLGRRKWHVVTITMTVLGAVFLFRTREPKVYKQIGKDNSFLQSSKGDDITNFETGIVHSDESIKLQS